VRDDAAWDASGLKWHTDRVADDSLWASREDVGPDCKQTSDSAQAKTEASGKTEALDAAELMLTLRAQVFNASRNLATHSATSRVAVSITTWPRVHGSYTRATCCHRGVLPTTACCIGRAVPPRQSTRSQPRSAPHSRSGPCPATDPGAIVIGLTQSVMTARPNRRLSLASSSAARPLQNKQHLFLGEPVSLSHDIWQLLVCPAVVSQIGRVLLDGSRRLRHDVTEINLPFALHTRRPGAAGTQQSAPADPLVSASQPRYEIAQRHNLKTTKVLRARPWFRVGVASNDVFEDTRDKKKQRCFEHD